MKCWDLKYIYKKIHLQNRVNPKHTFETIKESWVKGGCLVDRTYPRNGL